MSFYNKSTNFAVKDSLTTGDPNKIVSGVEIDTEFTNIASGFSGVDSSISSLTSEKSNKASNPTEGNVATLTSDGNIQDSGKTPYDTDDLKTDLSATGDAPVFAVRAWTSPNFVASGLSGVGRSFESENISSITRLSTGFYRVTFITAMEDANYAIAATPTGSDKTMAIRSQAANSFEVQNTDVSDANVDDEAFAIIIVR